MPQRKKSVQVEVEEQVDWAPKIDEKAETADLRPVLEKVKSKEGVVGYIIRGPTSASVDIKDPRKIIDYATLSAEAMESGESLSSAFGIGKLSYIVLEGKTVKVLCWTKGEHQLSVFMDKTVDHNTIYKEIA